VLEKWRDPTVKVLFESLNMICGLQDKKTYSNVNRISSNRSLLEQEQKQATRNMLRHTSRLYPNPIQIGFSDTYIQIGAED